MPDTSITTSCAPRDWVITHTEVPRFSNWAEIQVSPLSALQFTGTEPPPLILQLTAAESPPHCTKLHAGKVIRNLLAGIVSPVSALFKNWKNFAIGMSCITGAAIAVTVIPHSAPLFVVGSLATAAVSLTRGLFDLISSHDISVREASFVAIGAGLTGLFLAAVGAKAALRAAGVNADKVSTLTALFKNVEQLPNSVSEVVSALRDGRALQILSEIVLELPGRLKPPGTYLAGLVRRFREGEVLNDLGNQPVGPGSQVKDPSPD